MRKGTLRGIALALSMMASLHAAKLPRPAAPFSINLPDGKEYPLAAQKGKVLAVCFILTTCPHCQSYSRILNKMQYEFGPRGLQVVASAIEENAKAAVPGFIRAYAPPYPVGYNDLVPVADFIENPRTQVMHMPVIVFIDRKGMILGQYQAGEPFIESNTEQNLRNTIQGILDGTINPTTVAKFEAAQKADKAKLPSVTYTKEPIKGPVPKATPKK